MGEQHRRKTWRKERVETGHGVFTKEGGGEGEGNAEGARKRVRECAEEEAAGGGVRRRETEEKERRRRKREKEVDFGCERST